MSLMAKLGRGRRSGKVPIELYQDGVVVPSLGGLLGFQSGIAEGIAPASTYNFYESEVVANLGYYSDVPIDAFSLGPNGGVICPSGVYLIVLQLSVHNPGVIDSWIDPLMTSMITHDWNVPSLGARVPVPAGDTLAKGVTATMPLNEPDEIIVSLDVGPSDILVSSLVYDAIKIG